MIKKKQPAQKGLHKRLEVSLRGRDTPFAVKLLSFLKNRTGDLTSRDGARKTFTWQPYMPSPLAKQSFSKLTTFSE